VKKFRVKGNIKSIFVRKQETKESDFTVDWHYIIVFHFIVETVVFHSKKCLEQSL